VYSSDGEEIDTYATIGLKPPLEASISHPVNDLISMKVTYFVDGCRTVTTRNVCGVLRLVR
jgi:hypothetical protein